MSPKFNIDRPKVSDDELKKHQNFEQLVERFKQQSLKKARGDESWWKNKKIRYSAVIAGVTVVCTVTYLSLFTNQKQQQTHETLITQNTPAPKTTIKKEPFVKKPAQSLAIPYSTYKVNNAKGGNITHAGATKIKVPKNSFVDKNGKDVIGDVTIEYKEFHDLGDVIVSGIPMAYDSAGLKYNLESAGMFDIRGSQNGEPVFIKPEKTLQVELASANNETKFNQYYLDTLKKNWQYIKRDEALRPTKKTAIDGSSEFNTSQLNEQKKLEVLKHDIEKVIPKKIDSVKVVYATKVQRLPVAREPAKPAKVTPGRPSFKLDGSYDEFPELSAFNNVVFEVGPENKNYSKDLHDVTWSDVKISQGPVKGKNYMLTLSYRNRSEKLIVYPVLTGDDFEKAQKNHEEKLALYESLVNKRQAEEKRLMSELQAKQSAYLAEQAKKQKAYDEEKARMQEKYNVQEQNELSSNFNALNIQVKATRLFSVSQFGIYNSDCPHPVPNGASVIPIFVSSEKDKPVHADRIYLVDHTHKTVYDLDRSNGFKMNYDPNTSYSACIFSKNALYLCSKQSFKQTIEQGSNTFAIDDIKTGTDNLIDFKKALEL